MATQDQQSIAELEAVVSPPGPVSEDTFLGWCEQDTRAEWVDGEVIMMSPTNAEHSAVAVWLLRFLGEFVERRDAGILLYDMWVRLPNRPSRRVPDLLFVSHQRRPVVQAASVEGPPDLIVEIVSPDSLARDWREKYLEYEAAGVREYWVIDPASQHMEAYALTEPTGQAPAYRRIAERDGFIDSAVLPGLKLRTAWLWPAGRPRVLDALREIGLA